ncbi:DUF3320 domain-containing protein [Candidatus Poribacteria bacterium]|nr:DUF3320 domain-containing protein [Candidatus Poribacteria bacterium]
MNSDNFSITQELHAAREKLLDLTLRNKLLNYKTSKLRTIQVIDEIPKEVFNILVLNEQRMHFKHRDRNENDITTDISDENEATLMPWLYVENVATHQADKLLQTELSIEDLQKRLYYIHQQAQSVFEEQGYSVLHLALGFLKWSDKDNIDKENIAPLILIPVELERGQNRTQFTIRWSQADILPNLSLESKLSDQGISLPSLDSLEEKNEIDDYFQKVSAAVSNYSNWEVIPDIYLDFFSFTKFVMYKDLEPGVWDVNNHHLLGLVLGSEEVVSNNDGFNAADVDEKLSSRDVYHVMDADSSQIAVIEEIKKGKNLVVEGPPGTGKSQTITNIIAELLSMGKKVLFVSEKMAALEVVKHRLDNVGLGEFCLELHSHKSNKREVLQELERTMSTQIRTANGQMDSFRQLDMLKSELNNYVNGIHSPIGKTQKSLLEIFMIREEAKQHFSSQHKELQNIRFPNPSESDLSNWDEAISQLEKIAAILPRVAPISEHPWRSCLTGIITQEKEELIDNHITNLQDACIKLYTVFSHLETEYGIRKPKNIETIQHHLLAADIVNMSLTTKPEVLLNEKWDTFSDEAKDLIQQVEIIAEAKKKFMAWTLETDPRLKLDTDYIMKLAEEYEKFYYLPRWKRFFSWKYRKEIKSPIKSYFKQSMPKEPDKLRTDLKELSDCIKMKDQMDWEMAATQKGPSLFGDVWKDDDSNPEELRKFGEWVITFRQYLRDGTLTEDSVNIVSKGNFDTPLSSIKDYLNLAINEYKKHRDLLLECLGTDVESLFGTIPDSVFFSDLDTRLELWENEKDKIHTWGQFSELIITCHKTIAAPLLEYIHKLNPEDLVPGFKVNYTESLLQDSILKNQSLREFVTEVHEKKISDFQELDSTSLELNRIRLISELQQQRPRLFGGASKESEIGILQGQFNRKRGHMPIRKLLSVVGGLIQRIKPCFMMSPLSVAQFCDPVNIEFDVIVFDEASQIRPEDALGAMIRAKQAVVLGDTRQLPPTRFFDSIVADVGENEEQSYTTKITDVESILHQCRQSFPVKQLKWHYRSRHESLIAISNQEFYENELLIFPSPFDNSDHLGLKFNHIPNSVYSRGGSSANKIEAQAVVQAAFEHYRKYPDKSLGVGTFNMSQQQTILDEVEQQLHNNPEMNEFFSLTRDEHFFVKNLETIQGDERDTIFLSIGYGKDGNGKLYRNFGPLNHEGGERRLNVLITRAREKCVVFSNFKASDLQLDANAPFGTRALKMFLDYAENRNNDNSTIRNDETETPFEDSVFDYIQSLGYEIRKKVGCAGYRIDLGIIDPDSTDRYLIGIECDGRQYYNAPVARDRDRLRQQVLSGLGWKLHRVWSMEWYQDRDNTKERLLTAIENAKSDTPSEPQHTHNSDIDMYNIENGSELESEPEVESNSSFDTNTEPTIPEYKECIDLGILISGELHLQDKNIIAKAVSNIVNEESPVHVEQIVIRFRTLWGLAKAGSRIRIAIENGIEFAERNNLIRRKDDFLWSVDHEDIEIRKRVKPKIEWICDEEIYEAITLVLSLQGAITKSSLISEAVKFFGYKATSNSVSEYVMEIINRKIHDGDLELVGNGMVQSSTNNS